MRRRAFLLGAAGVVATSGLASGQGQTPAGQASPAGQGAGRGGGGGGRGGPANVPAAKLARIAIMTLNHGSMLKLPWNTSPNPNQTLALMDLPQYYIDMYGVKNVEFQHCHLAQDTNNPDPAFFKELKAKFDAVGSRPTRSTSRSAPWRRWGRRQGGRPGGDARATWLTTGKKWVDVAPLLGIKRLMLNQGALTDDSKEGVISLWKELQDYATPKGIMISNETRGNRRAHSWRRSRRPGGRSRAAPGARHAGA